MTWDETLALLTPCLPPEAGEALNALPADTLRELRIRANRGIQLCCASGIVSIPVCPGETELGRICEALTDHSLYARSAETSLGYVTLRGGHRMGLCGSAHLRDGQLHLQRIGSVCIRIAVSRPGCASPLLPFAKEGLMLIGPPGSGKTTLLRDLARQLSLAGFQTAVIDERCELSACLNGVPQLDIGHADVLCGADKSRAAAWLIRSMNPQVLVTDELGDDADASALLNACACGASILCSVHGRSLNDAFHRPALRKMADRRCFGTYALLSDAEPGRIAALYDRNGEALPI